ncbi:MAG: polysaccharide biosynthesis C-terminal domain-containing protein [Clostridia bacterium]|nr:polysaccharide biosynthesis C-terminal domain-containing protein [Clostridia bacterium]MBR3862649.1 polysaccharide biosynthesis C-terminal domain-containing protein [Clostridia bacterium]
MKTKQQYFYNALLLTVVTLLMRTVSVGFNVYVSGKVGAEAMGLLSLVSGVYGFAVTLATSGIHLATVRTFAERLKLSGGAENRKCLCACLSYAAFFGSLASILLFALARPIGLYVLKDARTVRALTMLAFTLFPIAVSAVFNGYFTAMRRAYKNAIAQVTEQAVKITFTGYLLVLVAPNTVEGSILAILMGGAVSETLTFLLNLVLYVLDKCHFKGIKQQKSGSKINVAAIALPVAISAYMRSGLLTIEHILIPRGLQAYGAGNSAALAAYGTLHGMALPVILYPAAILSSFSALLIPEITEQNTIGNKREIRYIAGRAYQAALLFSIGTAAVMLFLSGELGEVLYSSSEVGRFIKLLAPLIPIMYIDTATDALLKGLGEQVYSMNVNIIDALISVILVWLLVPHMGISGYLVTIYVTEIFNAACSICRLLKVSGYRPKIVSLFVRPLFAAIGATVIANLLLHFFTAHASTAATLVLHILIVSALYFSLLLLTRTLPASDVKWLSASLLGTDKKRFSTRKQADEGLQ